MVAIPYLAVEATPTPSSIVMAGATITKVLSESDKFSGVIQKGLAKKGITDLDAFYANAQIVIDAGEPANYAEMASQNHPIHLIESINDDTVPNSSTQNLVNLMGAKDITLAQANPITIGNPGIVRFTDVSSAHSSPLKFDSSTIEMHKQMAVFQLSRGTVIQISEPCIIQGATCPTTAPAQ